MATLPKPTSPKSSFKNDPSRFRERVIVVYAILIAGNVSAWAWAMIAFAHQPILLGTALLAYSLGLRHALDADHIAAIDNVTRKLMQDGNRPVAVGFFFALGHSTVVVLASLAVALTAHALSDDLAPYREIGAIIGTSASALFLFIIALANLIVLRGVYRAFRRMRRGEDVPEEDIDAVLQQRGWLARLFKPLFRFVAKSWQLYPIGLLFALGFETASEVSLFGLSAEASHQIASWSILVFPALFAAAMTLIDTTDGVLMVGAYGWAYRNPIRKLFYNLTITSVSVLVALVVGGIETLGLLANQFQLNGPFWIAITELNANFGALGYGIVALFVVSWGVSILIYRYKRYDRHAMPNWKKLALVAIAVKLAMGSAMAADAVKDMPVKAPAASSAPHDLAGFYVCGHVGYLAADSEWTARGNAGVLPSSGSIDIFDHDGPWGPTYGGLQAGYNDVFPSHLMVGFETDVSFPNHLNSSQTLSSSALGQYNTEDKVEFFGTVRARAGYAFDSWLLYGTGGFAFDRDLLSRTQRVGTPAGGTAVPGDIDEQYLTRYGWTVGLGAELALSQNWSAKLEYLFMDFGSRSLLFPLAAQQYDSNLNIQAVQAGLNYHFGDPSSRVRASGDGLSDLSNVSIHGQTTWIDQCNVAFPAAYSGAQSLSPGGQCRDTVSIDGFLGLKLWDGAALYFNPEIFQGFGLESTHGLAGFPNGEAQKAGFLYPRYNAARLFLQQTFGLGGEQETISEGPDQFGGKQDISRITVTAGKMAVPDIFDNNAYAHDSRNGFMNWSIWEGGAFDYAADEYGYTWGAVAEFNQKTWAVRGGYFLVPTLPNGNDYDTAFFQRGQYIMELEERYALFSQPGKLRLTGWLSSAFTGSFAQTLANPALDLDIAQTRQTRLEYGFIANLEQAVTDDFGVFSRLSWQNGQTEIVAWTDIDQSLSFGGVLKGTNWGRPDDKIGVAGVINGLSNGYRAFLAAGGLGINIGDGQLNYSEEKIVEIFYAYSINRWSTLTLDYQFVDNPGYNADRGPVSIFAGRYHAEF